MPRSRDYISVDPGDPYNPVGTTGICCWDTDLAREKGFPYDLGQYDFDEMLEFFDAIDKDENYPKVVICEDYRMDPTVKQHHSRVPTIKTIGWIEGWCKFRKVKFVLQSRTVKSTAAKWSQKKEPKGKHNEHNWYDAFLHGYYYLHHVEKIIPAQALIDMRKQNVNNKDS